MQSSTVTERILVIKLSAFGDFIQALGPMAAIRRHHPDAHITLLTTKPFTGFGEKCGYFNSVLCDTRPKFFDLKGWFALRKLLTDGRYTRVYDLQNNDRTNFYLRLFPRTQKPEWVGAAYGASHRNVSPKRTAGHALEGHIQTLGLAGIQDITIDDLGWIKEDISVFNLQKPYILIVAGCAPQHPYKRWPANYYGELAVMLYQKGFQPVLLGTQAESDVTAAIKEICPHALDLTGQTSLLQIATLAREAAGAIGNDTGPMHMIAPTSCPSLVLFSGASNPKRHAPNGRKIDVIQKEPLSELSVAEVANRLESFLSAQPEATAV